MLTPTGPTTPALRAPQGVPARARGPAPERGLEQPVRGAIAKSPRSVAPPLAAAQGEARPVRIGRNQEQHALFAYQQHNREPQTRPRHVDEYV